MILLVCVCVYAVFARFLCWRPTRVMRARFELLKAAARIEFSMQSNSKGCTFWGYAMVSANAEASMYQDKNVGVKTSLRFEVSQENV